MFIKRITGYRFDKRCRIPVTPDEAIKGSFLQYTHIGCRFAIQTPGCLARVLHGKPVYSRGGSPPWAPLEGKVR